MTRRSLSVSRLLKFFAQIFCIDHRGRFTRSAGGFCVLVWPTKASSSLQCYLEVSSNSLTFRYFGRYGVVSYRQEVVAGEHENGEMMFFRASLYLLFILQYFFLSSAPRLQWRPPPEFSLPPSVHLL